MPRGNNGHNYTEAERAKIVRAYQENVGKKNGWLRRLAEELGRPASNISRLARELGLSNGGRGFLSDEERVISSACIVCGRTFVCKRSKPRQTCSAECAVETKRINGRKSKGSRGIALWDTRPHPRGMLGKTHTPEYRAKMSERVKGAWADPNSTMNSAETRRRKAESASRSMTRRIKARPESVYSRTHKGWLEFEGGAKRCYFRSGWEMNYAHYLDWLKRIGEILDWEYEADTFWFEGIKRGTRSYLPDFKVVEKDGAVVYHEVKGWMDQKSKTKLARMAKYHPGVRIVVIDEAQYKAIMKNSTLFVPQEGVEVVLI
jgi:hypothetical protein